MKPSSYLIIALLAIIAALILFDRDPGSDYSEIENKIVIRDSVIHQLSRDNSKLLAKIAADSVSHTKQVQTYKDRDKKLTREIARIKASQVIVHARDSVPEVDELIEAYDSLIEIKDSQIYLQEKYLSDLRLDHGEMRHNFEERLNLQAQSIADQRAIIDDQRKQLRKERRKAKLAKVLVPIAFGAGLLIGL